MTTMMNMLPTFHAPHALFGPTSVAFHEDALANSLELDDADAANDIDEFAQLLSAVDDEETANDIDAFTDLIESLSKAQAKDDGFSDVPTFTETDLDALLGHDVDMTADLCDDDESDDEDEDDDDASTTSPLDSAAALSHLDFRTYQTPIDPRCCIKTPVFNKIDPRIPLALIPRMDVTFGMRAPATLAAPAFPTAAPASPISVCSSAVDADEEAYVHDPARCWVCKSNKSEARKMVLHRFVEKRHRRNWKRGARYKARSRVASSRVREGGRFVTKCQWFAPSYE
ncbi:hypothetical protein SDRG_07931 [Saprolegnia diclina VS20]|uniref:CCT domain-containing protein n=1 Tax=Saprolegnia diclina (strain VS20) TaxID=1156394 RepID=T0RQ22_SAPDV|nr:hypothetical protein SDRG_07931 [Saprolegnia diclina VS20]EQC34608.1 hypothetical protein SDRG_07931 [Saprolegnia diclina VS20]|eukprot:XP_008612014.1 hypothetical protein SDRG_07931 [Saprolegnia diclina VS20]